MKCSEIKIMTVRETGPEYHVTTPAEVRAFWDSEITKAAWYDPEKEMVIVLLLSARNHIKGYNLVTLGLNDSSLVHPREVFRPAIVAAAQAIILIHNHPSGNIIPSEADILTTHQIKSAGEIIGIKLLDHVIIGNGNHTSMRETGNCI